MTSRNIVMTDTTIVKKFKYHSWLVCFVVLYVAFNIISVISQCPATGGGIPHMLFCIRFIFSDISLLEGTENIVAKGEIAP